MSKLTFSGCILVLLVAGVAMADEETGSLIERGDYLAKIAGCHDCHTPGYMENSGEVSEDQYLLGGRLGWRGPWGTTYAPNLRLYMSKITEAQWLKLARSITPRPPMPWFNLRDMTDEDLRAIYQFARTLEPLGEPAPAYVPPDKSPEGPVVLFP